MITTAQRLLKPIMNRKSSYQPNVDIFAENKKFIVKTVDNITEWFKVLRFRHEVFLSEYGSNIFSIGLDIDRHDWNCDHLIIIEKASNNIVGSYRILCSEFHQRFYSESQYNLDRLKNIEGVKMELGRACVHPDFRNGAILQLLWRGISQYACLAKARYLFGCSSVKSVDPLLAKKMQLYFEKRDLINFDLSVIAKAKFRFTDEEVAQTAVINSLSEADELEVKASVPTLLQFYIRAGAKIYGDVSVDRSLNCMDFFTVLDLRQLRLKLVERYNLESQHAQ